MRKLREIKKMVVQKWQQLTQTLKTKKKELLKNKKPIQQQTQTIATLITKTTSLVLIWVRIHMIFQVQNILNKFLTNQMELCCLPQQQLQIALEAICNLLKKENKTKKKVNKCVKSQNVQIKLQLYVSINLHVVSLAGQLAVENCAQSMLTV